MKITTKVVSLCSVAVLLAACGGSNTESAAPKIATQAMRSGAPSPTSVYYELVESLYLGFFGRPADAQGLIFWSAAFNSKQLPATLTGLIEGYSNNTDIKAIVDAFADSAESKGLYVANNTSFINAVYLNVFNRNAEAAGNEFWSGFLARGELTRAQAVLWILNGGQNDDALITSKKIQAATALTLSLVTDAQKDTYSGDRMNEAARALLATITATTDLAAFYADINAFVASLTSSDSSFPAVSRYVGYHYLQDMSNAPVYAANYSYSSGGIVGVIGNGKLTYGVTPQTVTWSRDATTRALTFSAPFVASANLPATAFPPALSMLCTASGADANAVKSTDVLIARSAVQLLDAAELAGQTLSVYRENCAIGGSNVQSFVFDAAGNGRFASGSGVLTLDAKTVTAAMNGRVLLDLVTGKYLVFSAYSYRRNDGTLGYAIVQHLGNHLTAVNDGVLAVWSQE
ncbi:DUF4214 domain-containing protein [Duganella aceris]|uniref:DUF4214 domain-containing protein n=1 Tax=Duganella aceris TaxID=2703883 RepID=A0ABX0FW64_9BURK|nr:DUF4214 domain-containing protein [Duganella aceris]NGZ88628.1 DUF4214 domain-containing protein [Duganella aceris]